MLSEIPNMFYLYLTHYRSFKVEPTKSIETPETKVEDVSPQELEQDIEDAEIAALIPRSLENPNLVTLISSFELDFEAQYRPVGPTILQHWFLPFQYHFLLV